MGKEWPKKEIERLKLGWQFILSFFFQNEDEKALMTASWSSKDA